MATIEIKEWRQKDIERRLKIIQLEARFLYEWICRRDVYTTNFKPCASSMMKNAQMLEKLFNPIKSTEL